MANTDQADLMSIGSHCSQPGCGQIDFLPFTCDCCSRVFCLEHRSYRSHACEKAGDRDLQVIVCPLCAKSVKLQGRQDVHEAFDKHSRTECDPSNYRKVHHKPRCPVEGCRERLREVNTFRCKQCGLNVCLAHRLEADHACAGAWQMRSLYAAAPHLALARSCVVSAVASRLVCGHVICAAPDTRDGCVHHKSTLVGCNSGSHGLVQCITVRMDGLATASLHCSVRRQGKCAHV